MDSDERRLASVNLAIGYYDRLAKTRMILPKRDDCDLAVEVSPTVAELLATADQIHDWVHYYEFPEPSVEAGDG